MASLRVGAGLSTDVDAARAAAEATADATAGFRGEHPNLVVAFVSTDHRDAAEDVSGFLGERFPDAAVIGCAADGIIGGQRELESGPAVSIWAGVLPETDVRAFGLQFIETGDGEHEYRGWPEDLSRDAQLLMLCDRFSFPAAHLTEEVNHERPGTLVVGGIVSGGAEAGDTRLFYGGKVFTEGAVAAAISGRVVVRPLVSQGCRALGSPATVTRADRQVIFELAGERPIDRIRDLWKRATPRDRALMAGGPLFIGRCVNEYKSEFEPGDFLIRHVVGADPETGIVVVGDIVGVGETVQFHVRDPESADEDLRARLGRVEGAPAGAILFSCTGRGMNMFDEPDHDATAVFKELGGVPLAGFFAAGELGPVGGRNFLHGHTASLALFFDTSP